MEPACPIVNQRTGASAIRGQYRHASRHRLQNGETEGLCGAEMDQQVGFCELAIHIGAEAGELHAGAGSGSACAKLLQLPAGSEDAELNTTERGFGLDGVQQEIDTFDRVYAGDDDCPSNSRGLKTRAERRAQP